MLSPSPTQNAEDDSEQTFSILLTIYSKVKTTSQGKSASKQEKSVKMKELLFFIKPSNHINSLKSMLQKHGQEVYEVTAKKHYPFRYTLPKTKGQQSADVDNLADYREMLIPSPSHLTHFLKYTEEHLGVHHALLHKSALEINGISPDILFDIEDKFLADLGIC
ncbi:hypothetical protein PAXINDRAFT_19302 [Paxillus involutus ATCC 200175]|uniref:Uncharacterized protein n=1 Tax=Paxillus involutus ATCC 200175 TaxID=664439 RepID=A0A0C9T8P4_PAXIN|nr:hypothetical protein PAXINDRAFT_19302 [Paxillus involutus ATCC 200175]